jgi:hypothetical protein
MLVGLLDPERDAWEAPRIEEATLEDLGIGLLWERMSQGNERIRRVVEQVMRSPLTRKEVIWHRQGVLKEFLERPELLGALEALAEEGLRAERKSFLGLSARSPGALLYGARQILWDVLAVLERLRNLMAREKWRSRGLQTLALQLLSLEESFFQDARAHLTRLEFREGVWLGASLGRGHRGERYRLLEPPPRRGWWGRRTPSPSRVIVIAERDESGAQALADLEEEALRLAAEALARSAEHLLDWMRELADQLAFYRGALNLWQELAQRGEPRVIPHLGGGLAFEGLYDVGLALRQGQVVGNRGVAAGRKPLVITGVNRGGKTTFLRSLGLAYLMAQSGLFVGAEACSLEPVAGIYTHFRREENPELGGKLDEELARLSALVDRLEPGSLLLFNEPFASTRELEGSALGREIIQALLEAGIDVVLVTHLRQLAWAFPGAWFLRAEAGGGFRLVEGPPEERRYAQELLDRIPL